MCEKEGNLNLDEKSESKYFPYWREAETCQDELLGRVVIKQAGEPGGCQYALPGELE